MLLPARVQAFAARHSLWTAGTPIVAAVSGGADSVALLHILHELAAAGHLRLAGVAHLHHHIRGDDADEDARFVGDLAAHLGVPFVREDVDVPALARARGQSLEVAGREARLAFFARIAAAPPAPVVALAHTRTDQAETLLLRAARGAGARGLGGMAPRAGHRVRPLLDEGRSALRAWLVARGLMWREDATNADLGLARNRVRLAVMPELEHINPAADRALARAARSLAEDAAALDELASAAFARVVRIDGGTARLARRELAELPRAVARRVVLRALGLVLPGRHPSWEDTEVVLGCLEGRAVPPGGVGVELVGDSAVVDVRRPRAPARPEPAFSLGLDVPGIVRHPAGWWVVEAAGPMPPDASGTGAPRGDRVVLDAEALGRHLTIRGWQAGDRVHPLGLGGRKKLQDVFVDRKVPRGERPRVPVVTDARGRIAWVAGHVVGEPFRVTPVSTAVVVLSLRH